MTYAITTAEIVRRFDDGESVAGIARAVGVSVEVVRYRLKRAGRKPRVRATAIGRDRVRRIAQSATTLVCIKQFLEATRRDLISRMGDAPGPKTLDRLGTLNDFIYTLEEVTR